MQDPNVKTKKAVLEPRVYALLVRSIRGQVLHTGIHFSLDEAYSAARTKMNMMAKHNPGDSVDIELWNCISARECVDQLMDVPNQDVSKIAESILLKKQEIKLPEKTVQDNLNDIKKAKNNLMKKLIDEGNAETVKSMGKILTSNEKKLVLKKIEEKTTIIPPSQLKG